MRPLRSRWGLALPRRAVAETRAAHRTEDVPAWTVTAGQGPDRAGPVGEANQ
jgi:hypothetical protein